MIVIDTSALIAFLLRENGHDKVATELGRACISTVNLAEALARMGSENIQPRELRAQLDTLGVHFIDFDSAQAVIVGEIREQARKFGVGIADCCCLALALHLALPVLTADRAWTQLGSGVPVHLIR